MVLRVPLLTWSPGKLSVVEIVDVEALYEASGRMDEDESDVKSVAPDVAA